VTTQVCHTDVINRSNVFICASVGPKLSNVCSIATRVRAVPLPVGSLIHDSGLRLGPLVNDHDRGSTTSDLG
jgi:hypothetical protein